MHFIVCNYTSVKFIKMSSFFLNGPSIAAQKDVTRSFYETVSETINVIKRRRFSVWIKK